MSRAVVSVLLGFVALALTSPPRDSKVYRSDYVYNKKTDAFYKLHTENYNRLEASKRCTLEGASLMLPSSHMDIVQVHMMFKQFPDLGNYVWVAEDGQNHESAEEPAIIDLTPREEESTSLWSHECDVVTRKGEIETFPCFRTLPFMCKVAANDAPYNRECDVYGTDYKIYQNVSSCYKIPKIPCDWNQAYAECRAEGAHLVVINSEAEHDAVFELMNNEPKVLHSKAWWFFYAGFRSNAPTDGSPKVFRTIFNETLEEAGYSTWAPNEPNNAFNNEDCGTLFKNDGKLNDATCTDSYGFICEKEITPK